MDIFICIPSVFEKRLFEIAVFIGSLRILQDSPSQFTHVKLRKNNSRFILFSILVVSGFSHHIHLRHSGSCLSYDWKLPPSSFFLWSFTCFRIRRFSFLRYAKSLIFCIILLYRIEDKRPIKRPIEPPRPPPADTKRPRDSRYDRPESSRFNERLAEFLLSVLQNFIYMFQMHENFKLKHFFGMTESQLKGKTFLWNDWIPTERKLAFYGNSNNSEISIIRHSINIHFQYWETFFFKLNAVFAKLHAIVIIFW